MPITIEDPDVIKTITTIQAFDNLPLLMREAFVLLPGEERPKLPLEQMVASIVDGRGRLKVMVRALRKGCTELC